MSTELTAKEIISSIYKIKQRESFLDRKYAVGNAPKSVRDERVANTVQLNHFNNLLNKLI